MDDGASAPRVLCLGEALVDRLGPLGGDPAVDQPVDDRLGGAPANVACALARLGTPVDFLGRLGDDAIGASFQQLFEARGVGQRGVQQDSQRPTRIVLVRRTAAGERVFQGFAGDRGSGFADQAFTQKQLEQSWLSLASSAQWLLIGTIPLATAASAATLQWVVEQAKQQRIAIGLDVNWRPTFWDPDADPASGPTDAAIAAIRPLMEQASLIKLAREEALWFCNTDDPAVISAGLPQQPAVVVTDGAQPVRCCIADQTLTMPVLSPAKVVDTTGAGDAFTAGLLHCWNRPVAERLRFAAACGALVCAAAGAIDPQPTQAEAEAFGLNN